MSRKRNPIPVFESEVEERAFWESHDSTGHDVRRSARRSRAIPVCTRYAAT